PIPTAILTLSLHDALPISLANHGQAAGTIPVAPIVFCRLGEQPPAFSWSRERPVLGQAFHRSLKKSCQAVKNSSRCASTIAATRDRKSTRLNSSHLGISYA